MRKCLLAAWIALIAFNPAASARTPDRPAQLLLTPQHLRRLERERQRQTVRWTNFEVRVQSVPDSLERGFELALYYAVTKEEARGREAIAWAVAHRCEERQVALIRDWCWDLLSSAERQTLESNGCSTLKINSAVQTARDELFESVVSGRDISTIYETAWNGLIPSIKQVNTVGSSDVYALCEFLFTVRAAVLDDPRKGDGQFFSNLPKEFLLRLKPDQVARPDWMTHIAALALVALDPNLGNSQFLQGWAMEDSQMLREGPGVAYEFLWADLYLPGIAYQNMDPWIYDSAGHLFARTDWEPNACWLAVWPGHFDSSGCPKTPAALPSQFGHLSLLSIKGGCLLFSPRPNNESTVIWRLKPSEQISFEHNGSKNSSPADAAGLWMVPADANGKICRAKGERD